MQIIYNKYVTSLTDGATKTFYKRNKNQISGASLHFSLKELLNFSLFFLGQGKKSTMRSSLRLCNRLQRLMLLQQLVKSMKKKNCLKIDGRHIVSF